jgi:hypothetical protein
MLLRPELAGSIAGVVGNPGGKSSVTCIVASCAEQWCCLIRGRHGACRPLLPCLVLTVASPLRDYSDIEP